MVVSEINGLGGVKNVEEFFGGVELVFGDFFLFGSFRVDGDCFFVVFIIKIFVRTRILGIFRESECCGIRY